MTDDVIAQARDKLKSYAIVMGGDAAKGGIGAMTDDGWKRFFETMSAAGVYDKTLDWRNAYDLRFVTAKGAKP